VAFLNGDQPCNSCIASLVILILVEALVLGVCSSMGWWWGKSWGASPDDASFFGGRVHCATERKKNRDIKSKGNSVNVIRHVGQQDGEQEGENRALHSAGSKDNR